MGALQPENTLVHGDLQDSCRSHVTRYCDVATVSSQRPVMHYFFSNATNPSITRLYGKQGYFRIATIIVTYIAPGPLRTRLTLIVPPSVGALSASPLAHSFPFAGCR
jgi:hypothetical protein